mgnify:CR=1 FL=1
MLIDKDYVKCYIMAIKTKKLGQKTPKKRKDALTVGTTGINARGDLGTYPSRRTAKPLTKWQFTPIQLDPQKDYLLVVSSSIPEEEYDSLCSQFDNYSNVIIVSADKPTVISLP